LIGLARPRRPAELVVAVAPDVSDDEHRDRRVGNGDPEDDLQRGHDSSCETARYGGSWPRQLNANVSVGGPSLMSTRKRSRVFASIDGRERVTARTSAAHGLSRPSSAARSTSMPSRWEAMSASAMSDPERAENSSTAGRKSGRSSASNSQPAAR